MLFPPGQPEVLLGKGTHAGIVVKKDRNPKQCAQALVQIANGRKKGLVDFPDLIDQS